MHMSKYKSQIIFFENSSSRGYWLLDGMHCCLWILRDGNAEFAWLSKNVFTEEACSEDLQHPSVSIYLYCLYFRQSLFVLFIYAMQLALTKFHAFLDLVSTISPCRIPVFGAWLRKKWLARNMVWVYLGQPKNCTTLSSLGGLFLSYPSRCTPGS